MDPVDYFVYDGDSVSGIAPQRPTLGQLGGGSFINHPLYPPDNEMCPDARCENQMEKCVAGMAQTAFSLAVHVTFSGGAPVLSGFTTVGTLLDTGDIILTDDGVGFTRITIPAGMLPPRVTGPMLTLNADIEVDRQRAWVDGDARTFHVRTKLSGSGVDCAFTLFIP